MKRNFGKKIQELTPEYRDRLTQKINEHLLGTYQTIRLRHQQGSFGSDEGAGHASTEILLGYGDRPVYCNR